ncbi:protein pitchfork-like [Acipenser ruthenus]|uniref:protein pitchfork-like n=1 Tax=Acipenser ruthenus TaxID=7906 RepID=UPI00145BD135|nr:protein pitchfork-like [Acipenser ruthenus]
MASETMNRVSFGSTQERKLLPHHCAPDRLGVEVPSLRERPHLGPGCYNNHTVSSFSYQLEKRPESRKGYTMGARTTGRFLPSTAQTETPSPAEYQAEWCHERIFPLYPAPFCSSTARFLRHSPLECPTPGPGMYDHNIHRNRKVTWPMRFGAPEWRLVPSLEKRTMKTELLTDKEFQKQRNRIAYLSLYFN